MAAFEIATLSKVQLNKKLERVVYWHIISLR